MSSCAFSTQGFFVCDTPVGLKSTENPVVETFIAEQIVKQMEGFTTSPSESYHDEHANDDDVDTELAALEFFVDSSGSSKSRDPIAEPGVLRLFTVSGHYFEARSMKLTENNVIDVGQGLELSSDMFHKSVVSLFVSKGTAFHILIKSQDGKIKHELKKAAVKDSIWEPIKFPNAYKPGKGLKLQFFAGPYWSGFQCKSDFSKV